MHNGVRDVYYDFCERGGLQPKSEAPQVLADILGRDNRRRPADVLCLPALALARRPPDGSRAVRTEPVCFDFAVVNALSQSHWAETAVSPGGAAEAYDARKRSLRQTERVCQQAGYRFWPVVHEIQGGMAKAADAAARAIAEAVAGREERDAPNVRRELLARVAVVVARSAARAIFKRSRPRQTATSSRSATVVAEALSSQAPIGDDES